VGIQNIILVGNKMDLINWNEKKCSSNIAKVMTFLTNYLKFPEKNIKVVCMSAFNGQGLTDLRTIPGEGKWYLDKGQSFIDCLDSVQLIDKKESTDYRKSVDTLTVKIMILGLNDEIFTAGYKCAIHCRNKESEMEVIKIREKRIARNKDIVSCIIQLSECMDLSEKDRIILRKNDRTIGFGNIIKIVS
jgi:translation elongation factor EF-1alpha